MKRIALLLSALVITVGSFASNGDKKVEIKDESQAKVAIMQGRDVMKLVYLSDSEDKVNVSLYTAKGQKLLSTNIKNTDGFIKPFNFTQLEEGEYTFEITDNSGTIVENVTYDRSEISLSTVYNIKDSQKYKLNVLAEGSDVKVTILDVNRNIVHEESMEGAESFSRTYDLSEVGEEGYIFKVETGNHTDIHLYNM